MWSLTGKLGKGRCAHRWDCLGLFLFLQHHIMVLHSILTDLTWTGRALGCRPTNFNLHCCFLCCKSTQESLIGFSEFESELRIVLKKEFLEKGISAELIILESIHWEASGDNLSCADRHSGLWCGILLWIYWYIDTVIISSQNLWTCFIFGILKWKTFVCLF